MLRTSMMLAAAGRERKKNYLLATEVDPNSRITVAKNLITFAGLTRNETAYVYDDFGAGHFSGDFSHVVGPVNLSATDDGGISVFWTLANDLGDLKTLQVAEKDSLWAYFIRSGADYKFAVREHNFDTFQQDIYTTTVAMVGNDYWFKVYRVESVGTYGTLYCEIYSDVTLTTLVDTLALTLTEKQDFRYLYYLNSYNDTNAAACSGTIGGCVVNQ